MTIKKETTARLPVKRPTGFTYRPDAIRYKQLLDLVAKKGVGQQGIVSIAISELHEREFPDNKR